MRGLVFSLMLLGCAGHAASAPLIEHRPVMRTASGAPAAGYWQQRVDHVIDVTLDLQQQRWRGSQLVTYTNASPDRLRYLWLRLDPSPGTSNGLIEVEQVLDAAGVELATYQTADRLRIDLPNALEPGESVRFSMTFSLALLPTVSPESPRLYPGVDFYPRLAAYTDSAGWGHGSAGGGRELGSFLVRITVPEHFLVAAGGELVNPREVLDARSRDRLGAARNAHRAVIVLGPRAALQRARHPASGSKTWVFSGERLRDFGFAALTGYVWEARRASARGPLLMSYYPARESDWRQIAGRALDDAIATWQAVLGDYPWPVATVIRGDRDTSAGMFATLAHRHHGPAAEQDMVAIGQALAGSWLSQMIGAADPWMDELLEQLAAGIDSGQQASADAPSTGLVNLEPSTLEVLREEILGAEAFDFALAEFIRRWQFRRAAGADFLRSLADASGRPMDGLGSGWRPAGHALDRSIDPAGGRRLPASISRSPDAPVESPPE